MQFDVYTCSHLDPTIVFNWLEQYKPVKIDYKYIDREFKLDFKRKVLNLGGNNFVNTDILDLLQSLISNP